MTRRSQGRLPSVLRLLGLVLALLFGAPGTALALEVPALTRSHCSFPRLVGRDLQAPLTNGGRDGKVVCALSQPRGATSRARLTPRSSAG